MPYPSDLPGYRWLRRQLSGVDEVAGGYQNKMGNPMTGGAGFQMSAIFVLLWLLMLLPLSAWAMGRYLVSRLRRR
jgi:hypothetical protein